MLDSMLVLQPVIEKKRTNGKEQDAWGQVGMCLLSPKLPLAWKKQKHKVVTVSGHYLPYRMRAGVCGSAPEIRPPPWVSRDMTFSAVQGRPCCLHIFRGQGSSGP